MFDEFDALNVTFNRCLCSSECTTVVPKASCHNSHLRSNVHSVYRFILYVFTAALSCKVTFKLQQDSLKKSKSSESSAKEEEQREEGNEEETPLIMGSFSAQLGCLNPYLYDQFSVRTTEQRINQIILLQVGTCSITGGPQRGILMSLFQKHRQNLTKLMNKMK